ncbi:uncharacterized protein LOC127284259 isoform X2 [Leptopilina boulardi]|uniref:uncharacterized protein LOC127284259 isoform X2 n=1 Tax=Leptopilina boulardi TaxID=63433 RepID=UPI0021F563F2|nr:uncharacterized protein LOC127284259 isoform X2 [Leptopilina boulardi]XP_051165579.1 uncharacterized protein LOC127284259 isoform X2 [Leptopilina boulardi]
MAVRKKFSYSTIFSNPLVVSRIFKVKDAQNSSYSDYLELGLFFTILFFTFFKWKFNFESRDLRGLFSLKEYEAENSLLS